MKGSEAGPVSSRPGTNAMVLTLTDLLATIGPATKLSPATAVQLAFGPHYSAEHLNAAIRTDEIKYYIAIDRFLVTLADISAWVTSRPHHYGSVVGRLGTIYFVGHRDRIKIGFTSRGLDERLRTLQISSPDRLQVFALLWGTIAGERQLHERFAPWRLSGEWFQGSPELRAFIDRAVALQFRRELFHDERYPKHPRIGQEERAA